jgi:hypothetical protein
MKKLIFAVLTVCFITTEGYTSSNKEDYELQEKCAKEAKERFDKEFLNAKFRYYGKKYTKEGNGKRDKKGIYEWEKKSYRLAYQNHFNRKTNRCFLLVS